MKKVIWLFFICFMVAPQAWAGTVVIMDFKNSSNDQAMAGLSDAIPNSVARIMRKYTNLQSRRVSELPTEQGESRDFSIGFAGFTFDINLDLITELVSSDPAMRFITGNFTVFGDEIMIEAQLLDAEKNIVDEFEMSGPRSAGFALRDAFAAKLVEKWKFTVAEKDKFGSFLSGAVQTLAGDHAQGANAMAGALFASPEAEAGQQRAAMAQIESLSSNTTSFKVKVWTDKKKYKIGEPLYVYVKSDGDCYLTLIDFGTSGNSYIFFPNRFNPRSFVKAGVKITIPGKEYGFKIKVGGPVGIEKIKAICTAEPSDLVDLNLGGGFHQARTRDLQLVPERTREHKFVEGETSFEVIP
jgi:Domain of unknown function (DUF4384)